MKQVLRHKDTGNFLVRYCKSFFHALNGLKYAFCYEHNMYIILFAIVVVTSSCIYFQVSKIEWLFCIFVMGLVVVSELINSAIEAICDLVTIENHPLIKIAKDTASSATLICCLMAFLIGSIIFIPKIITWF